MTLYPMMWWRVTVAAFVVFPLSLAGTVQPEDWDAVAIVTVFFCAWFAYHWPSRVFSRHMKKLYEYVSQGNPEPPTDLQALKKKTPIFEKYRDSDGELVRRSYAHVDKEERERKARLKHAEWVLRFNARRAQRLADLVQRSNASRLGSVHWLFRRRVQLEPWTNGYVLWVVDSDGTKARIRS